jgi:cardiolipin synthase
MRFIKRFLFHRVTLTSIAILIQLLVLIEVILQFNEYFVFFYGGSILLSIVAVLWIINQKSNPVYKIAGIIPVLLFPIFGVLFYIFFATNKLSNRDKLRMNVIVNKMTESLPPQQATLDDISLQSEYAANQSKYIQNCAFCPPYRNTEVEYFPNGELMFEKLKKALKSAKHYIFLEYFIIKEGFMWNSILDILIEKASLGLEVRVIYDDIGSLFTLPYKYDKKLESLGIKCCVFNPLVPILTFKLNNRDHRKIAIIDGYTGFTGGINLSDEYINKVNKYGHWKDTAVMLKGEAVWSLTVLFLSMWDYLTKTDEDFNKFKNIVPSNNLNASGFVQPFTDSPLDGEDVGETVYINIINKARRYVYITTPYLIIDNKMITALSSAAKSGVDIRIITPFHADKWFVHEVTRSYYKELVENGVKIYEYNPGFIHSKTYVSDDEYGVVGTINMDYRSLYLHFECAVWMYGTESIFHMKKDFLDTLKMCRQIGSKEFDKVRWYRKVLRLVLRIFSPLM